MLEKLFSATLIPYMLSVNKLLESTGDKLNTSHYNKNITMIFGQIPLNNIPFLAMRLYESFDWQHSFFPHPDSIHWTKEIFSMPPRKPVKGFVRVSNFFFLA